MFGAKSIIWVHDRHSLNLFSDFLAEFRNDISKDLTGNRVYVALIWEKSSLLEVKDEIQGGEVDLGADDSIFILCLRAVVKFIQARNGLVLKSFLVDARNGPASE